MKKAVVIFLLLQITSNNAFAEELVKFPRLFTHFYHHTRDHKDTSNFLEFLSKHYSNDHRDGSVQKHLNDEEEDNQLPFKPCGDGCTSLHSPLAGFVSVSLNADYLPSQTQSSEYIVEDDRIESQHLCSIWQPPKLVELAFR